MIENIGLFCQAVLCEYWNRNPSEYERYLELLGKRLVQVARKTMTEDEYVKTWINNEPKLPSEEKSS